MIDRQKTGEHEPDGWRFSREISIPDIVAVIAAGIAIVVSYSTLDKRIAVVEVQLQTQIARDMRQDDENRAAIAELKQLIRDISAKLDRLVEKR